MALTEEQLKALSVLNPELPRGSTLGAPQQSNNGSELEAGRGDEAMTHPSPQQNPCLDPKFRLNAPFVNDHPFHVTSVGHTAGNSHFEHENGALEGEARTASSSMLAYRRQMQRTVPATTAPVRGPVREEENFDVFVPVDPNNSSPQENQQPISNDADTEPTKSVSVPFAPPQREAVRSTVPLPFHIEQERPRELISIAFVRRIRSWCTRRVAILSGLGLAVVILLIVLLSVYLPDDSTTAPKVPTPTLSTLEAIKTRGALQCGVGGLLGFSAMNKSTGERAGFEVDLCRAVGAAVFGSDGHVRYTVVSTDNQFSMLQSGAVDLLAAGTTYTIQSDVFEPSTNTGFTFSAPYLHLGVGFAGQPFFVACAEARATNGSCNSTKICVQDGTSHTTDVRNLFPSFSGIVPAPTQSDLYNNFVKGYCNVIAGEGYDLVEVAVTQAGYSGDYNVGLNQYTKKPLSLVTRDGDVEWSDFVNWVLLGLLTAETQSITQNSAKDSVDNPTASVDETPIQFYVAVATVGNYGEMYQRNLASLIPRAYANMLNNGTSPLLYSIPFGNMNTSGPGPTNGGTLQTITQRGLLRCGVAENAFFASFSSATQQWSGLNIDFCRAVAAAIFGASNSSNTVFVNVTAANRFQMLANGDIDIITRIASITYERNVNDPSTGKGFTFSQRYFYSGLQFGGIPPYVACAERIDVSSSNCTNLKICVTSGTTTIDRVRQLFPNSSIIPKDTKDDVVACLTTKEANVIAGTGFDVANATIRNVYKYSGPYATSTTLFNRDDFAVVTNQDDEQWSSFVFLVVTSTFYAEEHGISQSSYQNMPVVNLFGPSYTNMLRNVVQAVGSYSTMYSRSAGSKYPRDAVNQLSTAPDTPLHYPPPGLFLLL